MKQTLTKSLLGVPHKYCTATLYYVEWNSELHFGTLAKIILKAIQTL